MMNDDRQIHKSALTYYGIAESLEVAECIIVFSDLQGGWKILIPPTPVFESYKVEGRTIIQQTDRVWFILHRFSLDTL